MSRMCRQLPVCIVQTSLRQQPRICLQSSWASLYRKEKTFENLRVNKIGGRTIIVRVKVIVKVKSPQRFLRFSLDDGT